MLPRQIAFLTAAVLLVLLAGAACATDYFPLFEGYHVTYRGFDPEEGEYYYSMGITSTKVINGTTTYVVACPDGDDPRKGYVALAKVGGAVKVFETFDPESGTYTYPTPQVLRPALPTVGTQWTYLREVGVLYTCTVLADDETVETAAGTFHNCLKFKEQAASGSYNYHWHAPGVGEVKFEDFDAPEYFKETEEIVSFTQSASCDDTPPSTPVVTCEPVSYGNALHGVWTASDPESGVIEYQIGMSTTPDMTGFMSDLGWNSQAGMTATTSQGMGEFLEDGHTYYALVKARNGAGLWSEVGVSGPITVHLSPLGTSPWPLEVGNIWRYQIHSAESGDRVGSLSVTGSIQVGGQTRYTVNESQGYYDLGNDPQKMTAAWSNGEMRLYSMDDQTIDPPLLLAKDPLTAGLGWTCPEPDGGTTRFEVVADSETVVTPAGTFAGCAKMRQTWSDWPDSLDIWWFKPGVGVVQTDTYEDFDWVDVKEHRVLSDWHVCAGPTDITPPTKPVVADDGAVSCGNILNARFASSDPESAIADYQVAVSTTPNEEGIILEATWRSTCGSNTWTSQYPSGLIPGETYYILVKALNSAGLWSEVAVSDGIRVEAALPSNNLLPLHPANKWQYERYDYESGLESHFLATASVFDPLAFEVRNLRGTCDTMVCGEDSDGFYLYGMDGVMYEPEWHQLAYPLSAGQQSVYGDVMVTVEAIDDVAYVPAGLFEGCVRLRIDSQDGVSLVEWFAPGVGLVQEEVYWFGTSIGFQWLVGYSVHPTDPGAGMKLDCDGTLVYFKGAIVSAAWPDVFYIETDGRNSGIRVEKTGHGILKDDVIDLSGILKTDEDTGERCMEAMEIACMGNDTVAPIAMPIRSVGGAAWNYDPLLKRGQAGITGGIGLNNVGLLVRVYGHITDRDPSPDPRWFVLDDGSGRGVRCELPDGVSFDSHTGPWEVSVTGISSLYLDLDGTTVKSRILIRDSDDVKRLRILG